MMLRRQLDGHAIPEGASREAYLDYASLAGLEVLDDRGDRVGHLKDAKIDPIAWLSLCTGCSMRAGGAGSGSSRRFFRDRAANYYRVGAMTLPTSGGAPLKPGEVTSWSRELMLIKSLWKGLKRAHPVRPNSSWQARSPDRLGDATVSISTQRP